MRCPVCREILATSDLGLQSHWRRRGHDGEAPHMANPPPRAWTEGEMYEAAQETAVARAALLPNAYNKFQGAERRMRSPGRKGGF